METPEAIAIAVASSRRAEFLAALSPKLVEREDRFRKRLALDNASCRSKLHKIYAFIDELSKAREPFVACRRGCSSCCMMNVSISKLEARLIATATGREPANVATALIRPIDTFVGTPCPFLIEHECSIYANRPYVCRKHASFDLSPYWCEPSRSQAIRIPMLEFSEVEKAFLDVTDYNGNGIFADIRDFFPPAPATVDA